MDTINSRLSQLADTEVEVPQDLLRSVTDAVRTDPILRLRGAASDGFTAAMQLWDDPRVRRGVGMSVGAAAAAATAVGVLTARRSRRAAVA